MTEEVRILVVEDNPADADFIRETLPETGLVSFQVESVSRLSEALIRLASPGIDLVLLDLGLPDSQGLQTYHKLRQAAPHLPVIVLTGTDDYELAIAALRDGAQDYLVKGQVDGRLLARSARYALERQRAEERTREQLVELRRWEAVMIGREQRIMTIKREVNELLRRLGEPIRYPSQAAGSADSETARSNS